MGSPKKKNQHFVPRFVLRNFSTDGRSLQGLVLAHDIVLDRASIAGQCARSYFYGRDAGLEESFQEIERNAAAIFRSAVSSGFVSLPGRHRTREIEDYSDVSHHPLSQLREFVFYQFHRTQAAVEDLNNRVDAFMKHVAHKTPAFQSDERRAALEHVQIVPTNTIHEILFAAAATHLIVLDLTVKFIVASTPSFVISDNPVVRRNEYAEAFPDGIGELGLVARGLQMFMPLSPTVVVAIYDAGVYDCGTSLNDMVTAGPKVIRRLNEMQARNAHACLYSHPTNTHELHGLRSIWSARGGGPRIVEGTLRPTGADTYDQAIYTLDAPSLAQSPLPCFRLKPAPSLGARRETPDMKTHPVRSQELYEATKDFERLLDWKTKEGAMARGIKVDPSRREWFDRIRDPRLPKKTLRKRMPTSFASAPPAASSPLSYLENDDQLESELARLNRYLLKRRGTSTSPQRF